ncbi:MAG TPA: endolytic transglycosylase MltG [Puia sp.]|nr:endolytic transglycosylase MltG [Puia sp.]
MKRFLVTILVIVVLALGFVAWRIFGPGTAFSGDSYALYIRTGMTYPQLRNLLEKDTVIKSPAFFDWIAQRMNYPANLKAGKYDIKKDMSLISILRVLHNGRQTPVHLVILKFRTAEGLAGAVGKKFECDSDGIAAFIHNNDSLRPFGVDTNTFLTIVMPNTYTYFWNTPPSAIFRKMYAGYRTWWTPRRINEARSKGLNPTTATILASIVEEETTIEPDKGKIASVYLNRLARGIRLGADPTVKYALRDFDMKRVYDKDLKVASPYNTYEHNGLPPGPICTPSPQTIDAVLTAPATDYLFFVARPDNSHYSNFASTYKQHLENAKAYQQWLDRQMAIRAHNDSLKK